MISDKQVRVSIGCLVAYGLWLMTVACLMFGAARNSMILDSWGLATSAAAATATIRQYFVRQNRLLRKVFELAHDDGIVEPSSGLRRLR